MGSMDVGWSDLGSWTALLAAIGARGDGRRRPGRRDRRRSTASDLVVRRVDGRLGVIAPLERGSMTAAQPIAVLRGAAPRHRPVRGAHRSLRRTGRLTVTTTSGACRRPTTIVFGTDGWRARIADEFTFENVRRCADGVAHYVVETRRDGQGRRHRLRPAVRLRALRRGGRGGRPRPRHPGRVRRARRADPDELVRGRRARRRRRHRHHRQPQPVGRQRLQGQGPDRCRRRRRTSSRSIEARLAVNGDRADRPPAVRRRRGGRPGRAVRPVRGLRAVRPADGRPRRPQGRRPPRPGRPAVGRRRRLAPAAARRRPDPVDEIHQERNPYFGGVNPEPIRPNVDEALGISPAAATTSACCSTATPTGPAPPTSAARSSTSSRSPAC